MRPEMFARRQGVGAWRFACLSIAGRAAQSALFGLATALLCHGNEGKAHGLR